MPTKSSRAKTLQRPMTMRRLVPTTASRRAFPLHPLRLQAPQAPPAPMTNRLLPRCPQRMLPHPKNPIARACTARFRSRSPWSPPWLFSRARAMGRVSSEAAPTPPKAGETPQRRKARRRVRRVPTKTQAPRRRCRAQRILPPIRLLPRRAASKPPRTRRLLPMKSRPAPQQLQLPRLHRLKTPHQVPGPRQARLDRLPRPRPRRAPLSLWTCRTPRLRKTHRKPTKTARSRSPFRWTARASPPMASIHSRSSRSSSSIRAPRSTMRFARSICLFPARRIT